MATALKVIDFAGYAIRIDIDVKNEIKKHRHCCRG
jgi:hypothetical protein